MIVALKLTEKELAGVSTQKGPEKDGMKGLDTATVAFEDVRVPAANVLGGSVGKGSAMLAECSFREAPLFMFLVCVLCKMKRVAVDTTHFV